MGLLELRVCAFVSAARWQEVSGDTEGKRKDIGFAGFEDAGFWIRAVFKRLDEPEESVGSLAAVTHGGSGSADSVNVGFRVADKGDFDAINLGIAWRGD